MRFIANKATIVLLIGALLIVGYEIYSDQSKPRSVNSETASTAANTTFLHPVERDRKLVAKDVSVPEPIAINTDEIKMSLQRLGVDQLNERKADIQKQIIDEQLIERFNRHELKSPDILKLRRLALESSLITIRLYELN